MRSRLLVLVLAAAIVGTVAAPVGAKAAPRVKVKESKGCRSQAAVPSGESKQRVESGGAAYEYFRNVPPAYDGAEALPVVVDFHGYSEGAAIHQRMTMLGDMGATSDFITITPQGHGTVAMWDTTLGGADVTFVGDLLDQIESTLCIDRNRVFVTGLSNGAFMTSAVACAYADRVAAVAPVAGIRDIEGCDPSRPVPVVAFHGTADRFVAFDGGLGEAALDLPAPDGSGRTIGDLGARDDASEAPDQPSVPKITAKWAKRNDCASRPKRKEIGDDVTRVRYRCPEHATVELYRIQGGGHSWPGSEFSEQIAGVVGPTTFTIAANPIMWKFFEAHPLRKS